MEVKKLMIGLLQTNTYLLIDHSHCIIIDPAANPKRILKEVQNLKVDGIALTHGHFDHIGAVDALTHQLGCDVFISEDDEEMLKDSKKNCSRDLVVHSRVHHYKNETKIGTFVFDVMDAPGHTKGSVLLMIDQIMFCGDVLFKEGIGRCDLYGGSFSSMKSTLSKIKTLPHDYIIYPGHGESTTLHEELRINPYLI